MKKIKNYIEDVNLFVENLLNKLNFKKISLNNIKLFIIENYISLYFYLYFYL